MKKFPLLILITAIVAGCDHQNAPDVSGIKVNVTIDRMEKDFFSMDTTDIDRQLAVLHQKHPYFFEDFIQNIVATDEPDTNRSLPDITRQYIQHARPLYDSI